MLVRISVPHQDRGLNDPSNGTASGQIGKVGGAGYLLCMPRNDGKDRVIEEIITVTNLMGKVHT
jgi:hypothetical protein